MLKNEQELGQLIERFVVVAEWCPVPVRGEQAVAQPMDGGYLELSKVCCISHLAGGGEQAVAEFEGCLLREGAEHQLARRGLAEQEQIYSPQHQTEGFA